MRRIAALTLAVFALPAAAAAQGAAPATAGARAATVSVQLMEWMAMPTPARVRAGKVTFVVKNAGKLPHDFVVLRTNLAPSKLPMAGAKAKEVGRVGRTPVFGPGMTKRLTVTLKPGRYVLLCNVAGHYMAGMRAAFRVV